MQMINTCKSVLEIKRSSTNGTYHFFYCQSVVASFSIMSLILSCFQGRQYFYGDCIYLIWLRFLGHYLNHNNIFQNLVTWFVTKCFFIERIQEIHLYLKGVGLYIIILNFSKQNKVARAISSHSFLLFIVSGSQSQNSYQIKLNLGLHLTCVPLGCKVLCKECLEIRVQGVFKIKGVWCHFWHIVTIGFCQILCKKLLSPFPI